MDACQAQGVETPTWSSDGGFVTITFKRPDFKSDIIENDKEDKKITEEGKYPLSTPQVPPKWNSSFKKCKLGTQQLSVSSRIIPLAGM